MKTILWVLYQACLCTNTHSRILVWQLRLNDENPSVVLLCTETVKYVVENNPPSRTKRGKRWRIINQILIIHTNLHVGTYTHTPTLSTESSKCYYLVHSFSALRSLLIVMANWFTLDESCITTHRWMPNTTQAFYPACWCWSRLGRKTHFPTLLYFPPTVIQMKRKWVLMQNTWRFLEYRSVPNGTLFHT